MTRTWSICTAVFSLLIGASVIGYRATNIGAGWDVGIVITTLFLLSLIPMGVTASVMSVYGLTATTACPQRAQAVAKGRLFRAIKANPVIAVSCVSAIVWVVVDVILLRSDRSVVSVVLPFCVFPMLLHSIAALSSYRRVLRPRRDQ